MSNSDVAEGADLRQIARIRLGHALVGLADRGALRIDVRIGEIGLDERAADRFRPTPISAERR
jgi:hypothetical protein